MPVEASVDIADAHDERLLGEIKERSARDVLWAAPENPSYFVILHHSTSQYAAVTAQYRDYWADGSKIPSPNMRPLPVVDDFDASGDDFEGYVTCVEEHSSGDE